MANALKHHWKVAIIWAFSLIAVGSIATSAQVGRSPRMMTETPQIISGTDIGFRIERTQNGIPIGTVVVRLDGRWVDTGSPMRIVPAR